VHLNFAVGDFWIGGRFRIYVDKKQNNTWRWESGQEVNRNWVKKLKPWSCNKPDDDTRSKDSYMFLEHPIDTETTWSFAHGSNIKNFLCEKVRFLFLKLHLAIPDIIL